MSQLTPRGSSSIQIIRTRKAKTPQEAVVGDFETAVIRAGVPPVGTESSSWLFDLSGRILGRSGVLRSLRPGTGVRLVGLMGCAERQLVPYGLRSTLGLYVWDCWPSAEDRWASLFRRWKPSFVFFTSSDAHRYWAPRLPHTLATWAPEAIEPRRYPPGPDLRDRDATLLELGRRHDPFHSAAFEHLAKRRARHTFSTPSRPFVFPDHPRLIAGLQNTVAMACFPGSMSHPEGRTGHWESMTHRYLEAICTRTLVVGHIPPEMIDLFGFKPGIDVDPDQPGELLDQLQSDPGQFQDLVNRARKRLLEVASWDVRVKEILGCLPMY